MSATPLSDILERVDRSLQELLRIELVDKGYLPDIQATTDFPIIAVNTGTKTFTVTGDATTPGVPGAKLIVKTSTGNDKEYTIVSSTFTTPDTDIVVVETIPDATADGILGIWVYQDTDAGVAAFETAKDAVVTAKGFCIEVFGNSSPQAKNLKRVPRIVYIPNRTLPGELGGAPDRVYDLDTGTNKFNARIQPPQTVDFQFDIHIVCNTAVQNRIMHALVALALPKRGYVPFYDKRFRPELEKEVFFIRQYSYRDIPNSTEGITESVYLYEAKDIFETEPVLVETGIAPIDEITIEPYITDDPEEGDPDESIKDDDLVIS